MFCVVFSLSSVLRCPGQIFHAVMSVAGKAEASTGSAKMQSWLGVKNPTVFKGLLPLSIRSGPLYFHQLCLSFYVITQKIRLPVCSAPRLFRCKISFCSVAGSQRKIHHC